MLTWLGRASRQTAGFWPPLRRAYRWVERVAAALANEDRREAGEVRRRVAGVVGALERSLPRAGKYRRALAHFVKVTRSYGAHLFACYAVAGLPRTNNDLEQTFGRYRYHERRASGRKVAGPSTVVRGRVRIVAALATRLRRYGAAELAPRCRRAWQKVRRELAERQRPRTLGRRFRRRPEAYLRGLEEQLLKAPLPP